MPPAFRPIRPHRTFEQAIGQITDAIANGTLRVGQALPGERRLAVEMDVSRRTIREAIAVLEEAGVVEVRPGPGGGTYVKSELVPADLMFHVEAHLTEISDVLEARRLIEPQVARLAGVYAEREDFEELERIAKVPPPGMGQRADFAAEWNFHLTLARVARNAVLYDVVKNLMGRITLAWEMAVVSKPIAASYPHDIHERTVRALRTRDPETIDSIMDEHLRFLEDAWEAQGGRLRFRALPTILMRASAAGKK